MTAVNRDICQYIERSRALTSAREFPMKGLKGLVNTEVNFLAKKSNSNIKNTFGKTLHLQCSTFFLISKLLAFVFPCAKIS